MSPAALVPRHSSRLEILRDRAALLHRARQFFFDRQVCEVDCPALTRYGSIDPHIDLIAAEIDSGNRRYLHSSPEYAMKRLLAEGLGDSYQLGHVFRHGEVGPRHNPEFTMVEWYRCGFTLQQMIDETVAFLSLFISQQLPCHIETYRSAMRQYAGIDYAHASDGDLVKCLQGHGIEASAALIAEGTDALLNLLMGSVVEKHLGSAGFTVIVEYPFTQSALAQISWSEGIPVAQRFEIYYQGQELANGYQELADPVEQRERLHVAQEQRQRLGKGALPIDERFLMALEAGLPPCCGVAVGFDRLMMLRHGSSHIAAVLPFAWDDA